MCLILDVQMPGMDGWELQRLLANANHRIPIIFVTAYASDDEQRRATQAGALAFLRKPVSEQAPISAIQTVRARMDKWTPHPSTTRSRPLAKPEDHPSDSS